jgi:hypothetical protein
MCASGSSRQVMARMHTYVEFVPMLLFIAHDTLAVLQTVTERVCGVETAAILRRQWDYTVYTFNGGDVGPHVIQASVSLISQSYEHYSQYVCSGCANGLLSCNQEVDWRPPHLLRSLARFSPTDLLAIIAEQTVSCKGAFLVLGKGTVRLYLALSYASCSCSTKALSYVRHLRIALHK